MSSISLVNQKLRDRGRMGELGEGIPFCFRKVEDSAFISGQISGKASSVFEPSPILKNLMTALLLHFVLIKIE